MDEHIKLIEWIVCIGNKRRQEWIEFAPHYGLVSPCITTNGSWVGAIRWMVGVLAFAADDFNGQGFDDKLVVDTSKVPAEILELAEQYKQYVRANPRTEANYREWYEETAKLLQPGIEYVRNMLVEQHGYIWDPERKDFKGRFGDRGFEYERRPT